MLSLGSRLSHQASSFVQRRSLQTLSSFLFPQSEMDSATIKHGSALQKNTDFGMLENKLQDPCATPMYLPIDFLKAITCDFSEEQELGRGGYGVVYKGVLQNGKMIAVKKLHEIHLLEDNKFHKEVTSLMDLTHQNIVRFLGYCAESRWEVMQLAGGKYVMAEIPKRLLCFEYLHNKSLDKHISAESCGLEWHMRYEIIRGICSGLHYLHKECHIVHLDLKPQNILLDDNMQPKITDFGMSRIFGQNQSRIITRSCEGTLRFMAPEYFNGVISTKSDLFSLGVIIIELMTGHRDYPQSTMTGTGHKDYPQSTETSFQHFIQNVVANWRDRLEIAVRYTSLEIYSQQVYRCIEIGLNCVDPDPQKRPTACDIIQMLNEVEYTNWPPVGQASHVGTFFSNVTTKYSNLMEDFDIVRTGASTSRTANVTAASCIDIVGTSTSTTENIIAAPCVAVRKSRTEILAFKVAKKFVCGSNPIKSMRHLKKIVPWSEGVAAQERKIGILSFEVANTIIKGSNLMESLSQESMGHLKEVVLQSEGVHCLISEDHNQLLLFVEADIREQFTEFALDVIRFGKRCKDPAMRSLDRYFYRLELFQTPGEYFTMKSELTHHKCSKEAAVSTMQYLIELAEHTSELYHYQATYALDKFKKEKPMELRGGVTSSSEKNHKNVVASMQKKSFWFKNMEDIVDKLVDIVLFMYSEINSGFYKAHRDQCVQPVSNLGETLGSTGLTLHYAQVVLQINALALVSPSVSKIARDALYQTLPPNIKLILHSKLRECLPMEKMTVTEVRADMDRILQWLVPLAHSTRLYRNNGAFGERAMKGAEDLDVDSAEDYKYNISAIPGFNSANARVNKVETLFYADKGRTEGYILYLVQALHRLVCYQRGRERERERERESEVRMNRIVHGPNGQGLGSIVHIGRKPR